MVNLPFWNFADIGLGMTVFGASKVLTLSTCGAVSVSPDAELAVAAGKMLLRFRRLIWINIRESQPEFADASLAAMASTRGK